MFDLNKFLEIEKNLPSYIDRVTFVKRTYYAKGKVVAFVNGDKVTIPEDSVLAGQDVNSYYISQNYPIVEIEENLDKFREARSAANKQVDDLFAAFWDEFFVYNKVTLNNKKRKVFIDIVQQLVDEKSINEYHYHANELIELLI